MKDYHRGSHSVFELHVHLVWSTKYRKRVQEKGVGCRLRELLRQVCSDQKVEVLSGVVAKDHVHMLVSILPQVSVSKLIQKLKGKSSYKLQYSLLRYAKNIGGQRMWARGYFACSTGNVTDDMVKAYLASHTDGHDDFHLDTE